MSVVQNFAVSSNSTVLLSGLEAAKDSQNQPVTSSDDAAQHQSIPNLSSKASQYQHLDSFGPYQTQISGPAPQNGLAPSCIEEPIQSIQSHRNQLEDKISTKRHHPYNSSQDLNDSSLINVNDMLVQGNQINIQQDKISESQKFSSPEPASQQSITTQNKRDEVANTEQMDAQPGTEHHMSICVEKDMKQSDQSSYVFFESGNPSQVNPTSDQANSIEHSIDKDHNTPTQPEVKRSDTYQYLTRQKNPTQSALSMQGIPQKISMKVKFHDSHNNKNFFIDQINEKPRGHHFLTGETLEAINISYQDLSKKESSDTPTDVQIKIMPSLEVDPDEHARLKMQMDQLNQELTTLPLEGDQKAEDSSARHEKQEMIDKLLKMTEEKITRELSLRHQQKAIAKLDEKIAEKSTQNNFSQDKFVDIFSQQETLPDGVMHSIAAGTEGENRLYGWRRDMSENDILNNFQSRYSAADIDQKKNMNSSDLGPFYKKYIKQMAQSFVKDRVHRLKETFEALQTGQIRKNCAHGVSLSRRLPPSSRLEKVSKQEISMRNIATSYQSATNMSRLDSLKKSSPTEKFNDMIGSSAPSAEMILDKSSIKLGLLEDEIYKKPKIVSPIKMHAKTSSKLQQKNKYMMQTSIHGVKKDIQPPFMRMTGKDLKYRIGHGDKTLDQVIKVKPSNILSGSRDLIYRRGGKDLKQILEDQNAQKSLQSNLESQRSTLQNKIQEIDESQLEQKHFFIDFQIDQKDQSYADDTTFHNQSIQSENRSEKIFDPKLPQQQQQPNSKPDENLPALMNLQHFKKTITRTNFQTNKLSTNPLDQRPSQFKTNVLPQNLPLKFSRTRSIQGPSSKTSQFMDIRDIYGRGDDMLCIQNDLAEVGYSVEAEKQSKQNNSECDVKVETSLFSTMLPNKTKHYHNQSLKIVKKKRSQRAATLAKISRDTKNEKFIQPAETPREREISRSIRLQKQRWREQAFIKERVASQDLKQPTHRNTLQKHVWSGLTMQSDSVQQLVDDTIRHIYSDLKMPTTKQKQEENLKKRNKRLMPVDLAVLKQQAFKQFDLIRDAEKDIERTIKSKQQIQYAKPPSPRRDVEKFKYSNMSSKLGPEEETKFRNSPKKLTSLETYADSIIGTSFIGSDLDPTKLSVLKIKQKKAERKLCNSCVVEGSEQPSSKKKEMSNTTTSRFMFNKAGKKRFLQSNVDKLAADIMSGSYHTRLQHNLKKTHDYDRAAGRTRQDYNLVSAPSSQVKVERDISADQLQSYREQRSLQFEPLNKNFQIQNCSHRSMRQEQQKATFKSVNQKPDERSFSSSDSHTSSGLDAPNFQGWQLMRKQSQESEPDSLTVHCQEQTIPQKPPAAESQAIKEEIVISQQNLQNSNTRGKQNLKEQEEYQRVSSGLYKIDQTTASLLEPTMQILSGHSECQSTDHNATGIEQNSGSENINESLIKFTQDAEKVVRQVVKGQRTISMAAPKANVPIKRQLWQTLAPNSMNLQQNKAKKLSKDRQDAQSSLQTAKPIKGPAQNVVSNIPTKIQHSLGANLGQGLNLPNPLSSAFGSAMTKSSQLSGSEIQSIHQPKYNAKLQEALQENVFEKNVLKVRTQTGILSVPDEKHAKINSAVLCKGGKTSVDFLKTGGRKSPLETKLMAQQRPHRNSSALIQDEKQPMLHKGMSQSELIKDSYVVETPIDNISGGDGATTLVKSSVDGSKYGGSFHSIKNLPKKYITTCEVRKNIAHYRSTDTITIQEDQQSDRSVQNHDIITAIRQTNQQHQVVPNRWKSPFQVHVERSKAQKHMLEYMASHQPSEVVNSRDQVNTISRGNKDLLLVKQNSPIHQQESTAQTSTTKLQKNKDHELKSQQTSQEQQPRKKLMGAQAANMTQTATKPQKFVLQLSNKLQDRPLPVKNGKKNSSNQTDNTNEYSERVRNHQHHRSVEAIGEFQRSGNL